LIVSCSKNVEIGYRTLLVNADRAAAGRIVVQKT